MRGPRWILNASKYGHADFLDAEYRDTAAAVCATCHSGCDFTQYREFVRDLTIDFIKAIIYKDAGALKKVEDASYKIHASIKHDRMGYDVTKGGFCQHFGSPQYPTTSTNLS
jgi:hypothetical protein